MIKKCKCGCGLEIQIKPYHKYYGIPDYISGHNKSMLGQKHSKQSKIKNRNSHIGKKPTLKTRKKMSISHKGKHKYWLDKENLKIRGSKNGMYGKKQSLKHKLITQKMLKKCWDNVKVKNEIIKKWMKACTHSPNKKEQKLLLFLTQILPKKYKFVGDGQVIIGGFNPDFINVNGQKKIIELYGDYWHANPNKYSANDILFSEKMAKEIWNKDKKRLKTYSRYGYNTLVIWEHELIDMTKISKKILNFESQDLYNE